MLMPKDFINLCLTGVRATDYSEASCFYMVNAESLDYDPTLLALLDIPRSLLPPIFAATEVIGTVLKDVCLETSLPEGLPVVAGTSDMAASILGSGVWEPGTRVRQHRHVDATDGNHESLQPRNAHQQPAYGQQRMGSIYNFGRRRRCHAVGAAGFPR